MSAALARPHSAADEGIPYGQAPDGRLVSVEDVPSGLACNALCPACLRRLVAKKGAIIRHHFAHDAGASCEAAYETSIHLMAKQIIADARVLRLPEVKAQHLHLSHLISPETTLGLESVELEVWLDGMRPDIVGMKNGRMLAIEIFVTHACDTRKLDLFKQRQIPAVEIDLSAVDRFATPAALQHLVLSYAPRRWLFNPKAAAESKILAAEYRIERARIAAAEEARREHEARVAAEAAAAWERHKEEVRAAEEARLERVAALAEATEAARVERERREIEEMERLNKLGWAEVRRQLRFHATAMLGEEEASKWMSEGFVTKTGQRLPSADGIGKVSLAREYWDHLAQVIHRDDAAYEAARLTGKEMGGKRSALLAEAVTRFRNEDKAKLWFASKNPALGRNAPRDECTKPGGMDRCRMLLRKVAA